MNGLAQEEEHFWIAPSRLPLGWGSRSHITWGECSPRFDLGDRPGELDRAPYGANMAFRKEMFQKVRLASELI